MSVRTGTGSARDRVCSGPGLLGTGSARDRVCSGPERAKAFWAEEDVDQVFSGVCLYVAHLKRVLKKNTATDKEYVQALKLLESLDCSPRASAQDSSVFQVVIGSGECFYSETFQQ
ncbi:hypothetical protein GBF38_008633, partial [Nibea albiflora]